MKARKQILQQKEFIANLKLKNTDLFNEVKQLKILLEAKKD
jgi:hypothetical protein